MFFASPSGRGRRRAFRPCEHGYYAPCEHGYCAPCEHGYCAPCEHGFDARMGVTAGEGGERHALRAWARRELLLTLKFKSIRYAHPNPLPSRSCAQLTLGEGVRHRRMQEVYSTAASSSSASYLTLRGCKRGRLDRCGDDGIEWHVVWRGHLETRMNCTKASFGAYQARDRTLTPKRFS
jgi:hypothetical protein